MTQQISQADAVFVAVQSVVGEINGAVTLDAQQKKEVHALVINMFLTGQVQLKGNRDAEYINKYVPGLVNNWVRKDKRLNGNTVYQSKNPGSRMGSGDEALKAMKALLSITTDPSAKADIEKAIEARKMELKPTPKEIDFSKLPESLRHLAPQK